MGKNFRLSKKTAAELVRREFGFTPKLNTEKAEGRVYIYNMKMGRFTIVVENDWFKGNGLIGLTIETDADAMHIFYNPETLEEDFAAGEKYRREIREEQCANCAALSALCERR